MKNYACALLAVALVGLAAPAAAQEVVYSAPVVTYYAPSVPVTTYYAPAPAYYSTAPVVTYYAPAAVPVFAYPTTYVVPRRAYRRAVRWGW